jgi:hypothetical protein
VDSIFVIAGVILERTAIATGFLAAAIAVGGFLARVHAMLGSDRPPELQLPTAVGGLFGFLFGVLIIFIDVMVG